MASKTYEESIESIDERIAQLRARRRDEVARHEKRERSARNLACMALGEAVVSWYGDWRELDPAAFGRALGQLGPHRARFRVQGGTPSTEEAVRAYRAFRRDVAEADPADESEEE